jgi:hypothetical protein
MLTAVLAGGPLRHRRGAARGARQVESNSTFGTTIRSTKFNTVIQSAKDGPPSSSTGADSPRRPRSVRAEMAKKEQLEKVVRWAKTSIDANEQGVAVAAKQAALS